MDDKLYNVYAWNWRTDKEASHVAEGVYLGEAKRIAEEWMMKGKDWDAYIVAMDEDAGFWL